MLFALNMDCLVEAPRETSLEQCTRWLAQVVLELCAESEKGMVLSEGAGLGADEGGCPLFTKVLQGGVICIARANQCADQGLFESAKSQADAASQQGDA